MQLLFIGELNHDDLFVATRLRFKIYVVDHGERKELLSAYKYLHIFTSKACCAEFSSLSDDKEEIILSVADREALNDLGNLVGPFGEVLLCARV